MCGRIVTHLRALMAPAASANAGGPRPPADAPPASLEDLAAALVDQRPRQCSALVEAMTGAAARQCACERSWEEYEAAAPVGLASGSAALVDRLADFALQQRYLLALMEARRTGKPAAAGEVPVPAWRRPQCHHPGDPPPPPRFTVSRCAPDSGGTGDQMKGALLGFMLALLAPQPTGYLLQCDSLRPLSHAWAPHRAALFNVDWELPPWAAAIVNAEPGDVVSPSVWPAVQIPPPTVSKTISHDSAAELGKALEQRFFNDPADVRVLSTNQLPARVFQLPSLRAAIAAAARAAPPECALPPELWSLVWAGDNGNNGPPGADVPLPPWLNATVAALPPRPPFTALPAAALRALTAAGCGGQHTPPPPSSVAMRPGWGAPGTNLAAQLVPWLFGATPAVAGRMLEVAGAYGRRRDTLVIGVHFRVGTPEAGASYYDPPRDDPAAAAALAVMCAGLTLRRLILLYGAPRHALLFVASDNRDATAAFTSAMANASNRVWYGATTSVVALPPTAPALHLGKAKTELLDAAAADAGFATVFAELALLAASHGLVRARSGFSELAAGMGAIPVVYQLDLQRQFVPACLDMSGHQTQTAADNGAPIGLADNGLIDVPQSFAVA